MDPQTMHLIYEMCATAALILWGIWTIVRTTNSRFQALSQEIKEVKKEVQDLHKNDQVIFGKLEIISDQIEGLSYEFQEFREFIQEEVEELQDHVIMLEHKPASAHEAVSALPSTLSPVQKRVITRRRRRRQKALSKI